MQTGHNVSFPNVWEQKKYELLVDIWQSKNTQYISFVSRNPIRKVRAAITQNVFLETLHHVLKRTEAKEFFLGGEEEGAGNVIWGRWVVGF